MRGKGGWQDRAQRKKFKMNGVLEVSRLLWGSACSHRSINVEEIAIKAIDSWSSERGNNFHLYGAL